MANSYPIAQIIPVGGVGIPARIVLNASAGNLTQVFNGGFYRDPVGATLPAYTIPAPVGYTLIRATTFDIVNNATYAGKYTVYTKASAGDTNESSTFSGGQTNISVNEAVGVAVNPADALNTGSVTNISTYLITVTGDANPTIIPPAVSLENRPIALVGRNGTPWGEIYSQNFIDLAQNFASATAPVNPYLGQTWYDLTANAFKLCIGPTTWVTLASGVEGANTTARVPFTASAGVPVMISHFLNLPTPFIGLTQVFVDVGGGTYEMIWPNAMTFVNKDVLSVTFSNAQTGYVLIRA